MDFQSISKLKDIEELINKWSSNDGEGINLELKSSNGTTLFNMRNPCRSE